ncbi:MAG: hypothetical protein V7K50_17045 [Nostoc sp.]|uniref:hypothetical protein n=1 Tax=Nostoc sp. TaxID=1180 RepID=UPI002FFCFBC5
MASIKISELRPAGSEFFQDSESFLSELSENREIDQIVGGFTNIVVFSIGNTNGNGVSVANTNANTAANTYANTFANTRRGR